jgi:hypothetical protein
MSDICPVHLAPNGVLETRCYQQLSAAIGRTVSQRAWPFHAARGAYKAYGQIVAKRRLDLAQTDQGSPNQRSVSGPSPVAGLRSGGFRP